MYGGMPYSSYYSRGTSPPRKISPPVLTNNYIDKHDAGLTGIQGAETIVKLLRLHRNIQHLVLGHNLLGDAGCVALFDHLRSEEGKKHKIVEISLNANKIGDAGLWAIARYLESNDSLGALFLQNNLLKGDRPIMLRFALAVNRSSLHTLSLTCNKHLGHSLHHTFLPHLSAPKLAELHLSVCSLGPSATPALLAYLTSPRAWGLHTLKLNGNPLGLACVKRIIGALERTNWSVGWVEMHACTSRSTGGILEGNDGWKKCEEQLRVKVLERNRFLGKKAAEDALALLPCARPALLRHSGTRLPPELVIHVLSFLAPSLSTAQLLRVCTYAAAPDTLPSIGLAFPSSGAHHALAHLPAAYPSPYSSPSPSAWPTSLSRFSPRHTCMTNSASVTSSKSSPSPNFSPYPNPHASSPPSVPCPACARMRRIMSPARDEERKAWLKTVGCERFEPEPEPELRLDDVGGEGGDQQEEEDGKGGGESGGGDTATGN